MLRKKPLMKADSVAVFLLGAVFLFLSIGLVMLGGSVYRRVVEASNENDQLRTTLSYVANQVRRKDVESGVQVGKFHGQDALLLSQNLGGIECVTYLYCWEGSLRELFVEKGYELEPEAGQVLIAVDNLFFTLNDQGLIQVEAVFESGLRGQLLLAPRSGATAGGEGG